MASSSTSAFSRRRLTCVPGTAGRFVLFQKRHFRALNRLLNEDVRIRILQIVLIPAQVFGQCVQATVVAGGI